MFLQTIEIACFRNIETLRVNLNAGLNVIVGENNIGKTNLLDALRVALGAFSSWADAVRITADDLHRNAKGERLQGPIKVSLTFAELDDDEQAQCLEILNYNAQNPKVSTASINFEWSWSDKSNRWSVRRWAGDRSAGDAAVPDEILQGIPVTLLGALRDALTALQPGRQSRLGRLLSATASDKDKKDLEVIINTSNEQLRAAPLVEAVEKRIGENLKGASGSQLSQSASIQTSDPSFERIVNTLRLVLAKQYQSNAGAEILIQELHANGLGYNNLLYIATILSELEVSQNAILSLLLVEEPEAHLHPQLQTLLADFLAERVRANQGKKIQTIVTTHSPTIASHVSPGSIHVLHSTPEGKLACVGLSKCGLDPRQSSQLRRLLDVTKATMLFSRGVIFVEGICETLLFPVLARRMGLALEERAISVVPVFGVDFATLAKLFGPDKLALPVSIVTDGDPELIGDVGAKTPKVSDTGTIDLCARVVLLKQSVRDNPLVQVFNSQVTLEYDLAAADPSNVAQMCSVWESIFERTPQTLNRNILGKCKSEQERVLTFWRGVCHSDTARSKAELAQALAAELDRKEETEEYAVPATQFVIPKYIQAAIRHVAKFA